MSMPPGFFFFHYRNKPNESLGYEFSSLVVERETITCIRCDIGIGTTQPTVVFMLTEIEVMGIMICSQHKKIDLRAESS